MIGLAFINNAALDTVQYQVFINAAALEISYDTAVIAVAER